MQRIRLPDIPSGQLIQWTLAAAAVAAAFWLLVEFHTVVLLLIAAIILSTALRPAAAWFVQRGVSKAAGISIIFAIVALLVGLFIFAASPVLVEQAANLQPTLTGGYETLRASLLDMPNIIVRRLAVALPEQLPGLSGLEIGMGGEALLPEAPMAQLRPILSVVMQFFVVFALAFYWTLYGERIRTALLLLAPAAKRESTRELLADIEEKVGGYLWGQGLLSVIIGAMSFVVYLLIGLPHALLLAVIAGLMEAIPFVGPFLGPLPALIVALTISPATALWTALAALVIQQTENAVLVPRIMKRTLGVQPLVSLLALLAFSSLFGLLGALIALPLAAVTQLLLDRYLLSREAMERPQAQGGRNRLSVLEYEASQLAQDVRGHVRKKELPPSADTDALEDEIEAIIVDLEGYLKGKGGLES